MCARLDLARPQQFEGRAPVALTYALLRYRQATQDGT